MLEYYSQIRSAHIGFVVASGLLFAARGAAVLAGGRWPLAMPVRVIGHAIDTALLTAGIMLVVMLPAGVFANGWLKVKLLLLVAYAAAGFIALRRARSRRSRIMWFAVALLLFVSIFGVARAHHPLGWLALGRWPACGFGAFSPALGLVVARRRSASVAARRRSAGAHGQPHHDPSSMQGGRWVPRTSGRSTPWRRRHRGVVEESSLESGPRRLPVAAATLLAAAMRPVQPPARAPPVAAATRCRPRLGVGEPVSGPGGSWPGRRRGATAAAGRRRASRGGELPPVRNRSG